MFELVAIAIIVIALVFFIWYVDRPPGFYEIRNFDRPQQYFFVGHVPHFPKNICDYTALITKWYAKHKSPTVVKAFHRYVVNLHRAEHVEVLLKDADNISKSSHYDLMVPWLGDGLITSTGNKWRSRRRMLTPTFHYQIVKEYVSNFNEQALVLVDVLRNEALKSQGKPINVSPHMTNCTMDIVCEISMGTKLGTMLRGECEYGKKLNDFNELFVYRVMRPWLRFDWLWHMTEKGKQSKQAADYIHDYGRKIIREREALMQSNIQNVETKPKRKIFLDMLLELKAEGKLNETEVLEQVDTFMFAGQDTTGAALMFSLYCLGQNQDIQEQLYEEIVTTCGKEGPVSSDLLQAMPLLDRVVKEALRMYPSVPVIGRKLSKPIEIEGTIIPAGTQVHVSILSLHRNASSFPDPDKFDPDRFLPENVEGRHPFAYVPFSAGPRNCLGQKVAIIEEKVILTHLLRAFRFKVAEDQKPIRLAITATLRPYDGIHLIIEPRK